jgi:hypothetical protein
MMLQNKKSRTLSGFFAIIKFALPNLRPDFYRTAKRHILWLCLTRTSCPSSSLLDK